MMNQALIIAALVLILAIMLIVALVVASRPPKAPSGYEYVISGGKYFLAKKDRYQKEDLVVQEEPAPRTKSIFGVSVRPTLTEAEQAVIDAAFSGGPQSDTYLPDLTKPGRELSDHTSKLITTGRWYDAYREIGLTHEEIVREFPGAKNLDQKRKEYEKYL